MAFEPMLLGQEVDFRQVQDLTAFCDAAWDSAEVLTALAADLGTVTYHFIWLIHQRERVPRMSLVLRGGRAVASWLHRFEGNRMVVEVAPFERGVLRARALPRRLLWFREAVGRDFRRGRCSDIIQLIAFGSQPAGSWHFDPDQRVQAIS